MATNDFVKIRKTFILHLGKKECKIPGCHSKCYVTNEGFVHDFCGHSHATLYEQKSQSKKYLLLSDNKYSL